VGIKTSSAFQEPKGGRRKREGGKTSPYANGKAEGVMGDLLFGKMRKKKEIFSFLLSLAQKGHSRGAKGRKEGERGGFIFLSLFVKKKKKTGD